MTYGINGIQRAEQLEPLQFLEVQILFYFPFPILVIKFQLTTGPVILIIFANSFQNLKN